MRRLFANANYDFISRRRPAYVVSATALLISVAAAIFWQTTRGSWVNYGVDFTGGTIVQVVVEGAGGISEVRGAIGSQVPGTSITEFGSADEFLIRTPGAAGDDATAGSDAVTRLLRDRFGDDNVRVERTEAVSAKVGGELQTKALLAILISFAATLIYIAFRFEWRFGVASIIATLHDIILTLGVLSVFQLEISLPTVAAVLTIVGYSLNDTIVIFDRIRENLRTARRHEFLAVLNRSINDTLPRTVLTSGTTLVTLFSLFFFGTGMIREFALILIVGVLLGTYSSIFVAAPALLEIEKRFPHEHKPARRQRTTPRPSRV